MDRIPKVAALHDLSCFGRCSLAVIAPVLSVMGAQCCPLPGTVLSTHTGGYGIPARTDLTEQMAGALRHWGELGLSFDGVYTGYMASLEQIRLAADWVDALRGPGGLVVADPVLGDHGRLYTAITGEMAAAMGELCRRADVITPNLTEAALLLGLPPHALLEQGGEELARRLSREGTRSVVVTGVTPGPGLTGAAWFDRATGRSGTVSAPRAEGQFPGTGDLFAAVLTGGLMRGEGLEESAARAADFVSRCAARTLALGTPAREGVAFEPLLPLLCPRGTTCL